jgi:hypothetical protein
MSAKKKAKRVRFALSDGDMILPLGPGPTAMIVLKEFAAAKCCDGRMVAIIINRDGKTRCTVCDSKYEDEEKVRT